MRLLGKGLQLEIAMKLPKHYRQQIYGYIEELLGRSLTFEEHDDLRDMMAEYVFSMQNLGSITRRAFCFHDWTTDHIGRIEGGKSPRVYVKCQKCDKRSYKKMPTISMRV